jgi:electron transfer flavoprotein alpha subunit
MMDYIVLLKQVPKPKEMRVTAEGTLDRASAPSQINQDCQHALELALSLKDDYGGRVVVVSMGPPNFQMSHITALERGVDETVLLSDRKLGGSDTWSTGYALSGTLQHLGYNSERNDWIIMGGRQTTDGDTAHVPSQVAENLGIPQVTLAETCEIESSFAMVRRIIEGGSMDLRMPLPCMLSIAPTAAALRGRNMKAAVKVKKHVTKDERGKDVFKDDAPIFKLLSVDDVGLEEEKVGLSGSPTIVASAPKVEKESRDLQITDVEGLQSVVEGWQ